MTDLSDDIERYRSGRMSTAEMHALEKRALDDPFLADALAGAESLEAEDFTADVNALHQQLRQRTSQKNVIPPMMADRPQGRQVSMWSWPLRIAAALLIVAVAGGIFYFTSNNTQPGNLAMHSEEVAPERNPDRPLNNSEASDPAEDRFEQESTAPSVTPQENTKERTSKEDASRDETLTREKSALPGRQPSPAGDAHASKKSEHSASEAPRPATTDGIHAESEVAAAEEQDVRISDDREQRARSYADNSTVPEVRRSETSPAGQPVAPKTIHSDKSKADDAEALKKRTSNVFTGKVVSPDGTPLPGVNVMLKDSDLGTMTDISGNFRMSLAEAQPTLVFSFIGYGSTEEVANPSQSLNVVMDEDVTELAEVVVAGYGSVREGLPVESTFEFAHPVGGKRAYKRYLEKNLQYPQQALVNSVEGKVTVQFTVETTGRLSDFRIIKGIGNGCDEEVIRLIKEGPKWSPSKRDDVATPDRIRVRMKFQKPKK